MGEKRRRETGIPRIVCKAADRRFDRLLKGWLTLAQRRDYLTLFPPEDSLEELLTNIRQKLRLAPDSSLKLVRVAADGQSVDLEDGKLSYTCYFGRVSDPIFVRGRL